MKEKYEDARKLCDWTRELLEIVLLGTLLALNATTVAYVFGVDVERHVFAEFLELGLIFLVAIILFFITSSFLNLLKKLPSNHRMKKLRKNREKLQSLRGDMG